MIDVFEGRQNIREVNQTFLSLNPKGKLPKVFSQFMLIGLYNTSHKIVTKVLVDKIKMVLPSLISLNQSSLVPGRHIQDNIIIAREMIHTMSNLKRRKGFIAIKVDLEKTYDCLRWESITDTLQAANFRPVMVRLFMECITTYTIQILINGVPKKKFSPSRGVGQDDPLSPYIFVLCLEHLTQRIKLG